VRRRALERDRVRPSAVRGIGVR